MTTIPMGLMRYAADTARSRLTYFPTHILIFPICVYISASPFLIPNF